MTLEQTHECPICENTIDSLKLESKGLSFADLLEIKQYVKEGTLRETLRLGNIHRERMKNNDNDITLESGLKNIKRGIDDLYLRIEEIDNNLDSKLDTNKTDTKSSVLNELNSLRLAISKVAEENARSSIDIKDELGTISSKLGGTLIGKITEKIVLQELKRSFTNTLDTFSDEQSRKGGTDITATVIENKTNCGRISISVKDTVNWDAKHMTQLLGNMKQDRTQVGILATKSFPTEALGEKMYVPPITYNPTTSIIVLVKPESVSLAYFALRQLVIHIYEAEKLQSLKEAETDDALETVQALIEFYNGPDFKTIISDTTAAIEEVIETKRELTSAVKGLEKTIRRQDDIEKKLNHGKEMIETKIRKILYH